MSKHRKAVAAFARGVAKIIVVALPPGSRRRHLVNTGIDYVFFHVAPEEHGRYSLRHFEREWMKPENWRKVQ